MASIGNEDMIYVLTEYDLLYTAKKSGTYYVCTDSKKMYKDISNQVRKIFNATMITTESERMYNIRPANGIYYYVWETNTLWIYNAGWVVVAGVKHQSSGYYYNSAGDISPTPDIVGGVLDNNGLLGDGSIVVRDINRIIKGKLYIDGTNNNLVISSFLGGGIQLLPNGKIDSKGSLMINPNITIETYYMNKNTGEYIDPKDYFTIEQTYPTITKDSTPVEIYPALRDISKLPSDIPYDLDIDNPTDVVTINTHAVELKNQASIYLGLDNYVVTQVNKSYNDGYAMYNGEWNTSDEMYVNISYPLTNEQKAVDALKITDSYETIFNTLQTAKYIPSFENVFGYRYTKVVNISVEPNTDYISHRSNKVSIYELSLEPEGSYTLHNEYVLLSLYNAVAGNIIPDYINESNYTNYEEEIRTIFNNIAIGTKAELDSELELKNDPGTNYKVVSTSYLIDLMNDSKSGDSQEIPHYKVWHEGNLKLSTIVTAGNVGKPGGVAPVGDDGKIPEAYIPDISRMYKSSEIFTKDSTGWVSSNNEYVYTYTLPGNVIAADPVEFVVNVYILDTDSKYKNSNNFPSKYGYTIIENDRSVEIHATNKFSGKINIIAFNI